jgi:glyoxylase-like metal-dependent hydrolase (beta-lactamase superfamily II)
MEARMFMTADPFLVAPDTFVLPAALPLPQLGVLPMHAFVIRGPRPVLVDTGAGGLGERFLHQLGAVVDPADLAYIWLTHLDPDHTGALDAVLEAAPRAKIVTTFLGAGKLGMQRGAPPERMHVLAPGETLDLGDRRLHALRPPTWDAPETIGAFDPTTRTLFAADAFAATIEAPADDCADVRPDLLCDGMVRWSTIDMPWLALTDERRFSATLAEVRGLAPDVVLSSHLPPARGMTDRLLDHLLATRGAMAAEKAVA